MRIKMTFTADHAENIDMYLACQNLARQYPKLVLCVMDYQNKPETGLCVELEGACYEESIPKINPVEVCYNTNLKNVNIKIEEVPTC